MREVQSAVTAVKKAAHPDANIIFGAVIDEQERPELQVTVIAAGFPRVAPGAAQQAPAIEERPVVRPVPVAPKQETPKPAPVPEPAPPEPSREELILGKAEQEELDLFTEPEPIPTPTPVKQEQDDDFGIPTFLRDRWRKKKKSD